MKKPILVIMAAGMGSRYGGLKQVDPIGPSGEAIIDYSIYDAKRAGFETVVFIIKRAIEAEFKEKIGNRIAEHMEVRYAYQELDKVPDNYQIPAERSKPWGTGHALLSAKDAIDAPFVAINADDFYGRKAFQEVYDYLTSTDKYDGDLLNICMVGFRLDNTLSENGYVSRGFCDVNSEGYLDSVVEHTHIQAFDDAVKFSEDDGETWEDISGDTIVSMNLWGFPAEILEPAEAMFEDFLSNEVPKNPAKAEFYIPSIVTTLIAKYEAQVKVLKSEDKWYGVTYQEDKPTIISSIRELIKKGEYPDNLWK